MFLLGYYFYCLLRELLFIGYWKVTENNGLLRKASGNDLVKSRRNNHGITKSFNENNFIFMLIYLI